MQDFSKNDLLLYLYKETSVTKTLAIQLAIAMNDEVRAEVEELKKAINLLDDLDIESPSDKTMNKVLGLGEDIKQQH